MRLARRARNILRRNGIEVSRYFAELDWERTQPAGISSSTGSISRNLWTATIPPERLAGRH